jgi:hypothetical protein
MAKALITTNMYTQLLSLCQLNSDREYWLHYMRTINLLLACQNKQYVTPTDKRELLKQAPLERIHMNYLILKDPELSQIVHNQEGAKVWIDLYEYTFG